MPVAPVTTTAPPPTTSPGGEAPPASGFAEVLASQPAPTGGPDLSLLETVSLAEMVHARASGTMSPLPFAAAPDSADPAPDQVDAVAPAGDDWGAASERPAGATDGRGAEVIDAGERYLGVPYKWGGTTASGGFDCSGFVQQVYSDLGIKLPRVSADQARTGSPVASLSEAQPGDLVFWRGSGSRPNHIGIYAGDGKMLVAPRTGDVVKYQEITRTPDGIRRVL